MARPKLHKREETLKKALAFFWKNGFSGGSTRELGQALEMHPGSIYSSFGSKENLCMETIELYAQESGKAFEACFGDTDFFAGLASYLGGIESAEGNPCLCFLAKTSSSQLNSDEKLAARARELIRSFRGAIAALIVRAQEKGEVKKDLDAQAFASLIQAQMMGLRCLADSLPEKGVMPRAVLDVVELLKLAATSPS